MQVEEHLQESQYNNNSQRSFAAIMNSNLFQWNEMCWVPDWFVMEGFSLGTMDYLDDGESA